jgi:alpha-L-fucosidase
LIPPASVERLAAIGRWMKVNGHAIHGTEASPIGRPAWGRATQKPGVVYLHVFEWPKDGVLATGLKNRITRARLLAAPTAPVHVTPGDRGASLHLPPMAPDPVASVIALEIEGAPAVG